MRRKASTTLGRGRGCQGRPSNPMVDCVLTAGSAFAARRRRSRRSCLAKFSSQPWPGGTPITSATTSPAGPRTQQPDGHPGRPSARGLDRSAQTDSRSSVTTARYPVRARGRASWRWPAVPAARRDAAPRRPVYTARFPLRSTASGHRETVPSNTSATIDTSFWTSRSLTFTRSRRDEHCCTARGDHRAPRTAASMYLQRSRHVRPSPQSNNDRDRAGVGTRRATGLPPMTVDAYDARWAQAQMTTTAAHVVIWVGLGLWSLVVPSPSCP